MRIVNHNESVRSLEVTSKDLSDPTAQSPHQHRPEGRLTKGGKELPEVDRERLVGVPWSDPMPEEISSPSHPATSLRCQPGLSNARDAANDDEPRRLVRRGEH